MTSISHTKALRILVINASDEDLVRYRRLPQTTPKIRFEMHATSSDEEDLREVNAATIACVLIDYSLPGRSNGIAALKRLRALHPSLPVVLIVAQGNEGVAIEAMQAGAQHYLVKPAITPTLLRRAIHLAIATCAAERRLQAQRLSLAAHATELAHDLKEPVRTIRLFASALLEREALSEDGKRYFDYVREAADRMNALIDTACFFTQLDVPAQPATKTVCDLEQILQETQSDLGALILERKAAITHGRLPLILASSPQIRQLLQNLVSNAIRHCERAPKIRVDAISAADVWEFRVADNGPGIAKARRQSIFEQSTRAADAIGRVRGMGLAICRRIVGAHGGKIWCEAGVGGGAVFVFTLPKVERPAIPLSEEHGDQAQRMRA